MANNLVIMDGFFGATTMSGAKSVDACSQFTIPDRFERLLVPYTEPLTTRLPEAAMVITDRPEKVAEYQTATRGHIPILFFGERKTLSPELQRLTHIHNIAPIDGEVTDLPSNLIHLRDFSATLMARINDKIAQILSPGGGLPDQTRQAAK